MAEAQNYFGLTCLTGGNFYVCVGNTTEFLGCCVSDPCSDGSGICSQDDLRPVSFNPSKYSELPVQNCTNSNYTKNWYTCASTDSPFVGCCITNACARTGPGEEPCPINDLRAADLSSIEPDRRRFLSPDGASRSGGNTTPSSSATSTTETNAASASSAPSSESRSQALSTGAIIGISVAAVLVLIAAAGYFMFRCGYIARRKKDLRVGELDHLSGTRGAMSSPAQMSPYHDSFNTPTGSPYKDVNWSRDGTTPMMTQVSYSDVPCSDYSRGHHRGHSSGTYVPTGLGLHQATPQELDSTLVSPAELEGVQSSTAPRGGRGNSPIVVVGGGYEYEGGPTGPHMGGSTSDPSWNRNVSPAIGTPGLGGPEVSPRSM